LYFEIYIYFKNKCVFCGKPARLLLLSWQTSCSRCNWG